MLSVYHLYGVLNEKSNMRTFGGEPGHQSYAVPPNTKNTLKMTVFRVLTVEGIADKKFNRVT
jgi:hypothetical protein